MNPELDPREQLARANYLRHLYLASGRTNNLYTGLYQERVKELVAKDCVIQGRIKELVAKDRINLASQFQDYDC